MSNAIRPTPGQQVDGGRYILSRFLGEGGKGSVWSAWDRRFKETVALKFLHGSVANDVGTLQELRRETLKTRKLAHPNIVRLHDLHQPPAEVPFIAMEYVDGRTLSYWKAQQPQRLFSWDYLRPLVQQLCEALTYAHDEGVIHRDLKPANLMLDAKGRLKLADFGLAAVVNEPTSHASQSVISGTPGYMSPQQLSGCAPEAADDIHALGATLYELLTSKPPFDGEHAKVQTLHLMPEPIEARLARFGVKNDIPPAIAGLVMACLAKDPTHRPPSVRAVMQWIGLQLTALGDESGARGGAIERNEKSTPTNTSVRASRISVGRVVLGGLALVIIAIAVAGWWPSARPKTPETANTLTSGRVGATNPANHTAVSAMPPSVSGQSTNLSEPSRRAESIGTESSPPTRSNRTGTLSPIIVTPNPPQSASITPPIVGTTRLLNPEVSASSSGPTTSRATPAVPNLIIAPTTPLESNAPPSNSSNPASSITNRITASDITTLAAPNSNVAPLRPVKSNATSETSIAVSVASAQIRWTNSLGMVFVSVPTTHVLFCIWETRVQDYQEFASQTGHALNKSAFDRHDSGGTGLAFPECREQFSQGPTHPVVGVTWHEAKEFCDWLTKLEHGNGVLSQANSYRLPRDLEWSAAVGLLTEDGRSLTPEQRGIQIRYVFPWRTTWPPPSKAGNYAGMESGLRSVIGSYNDSFSRTAPVGSFPPNALGIYDLGGNVWEMCEDAYSPHYGNITIRGGGWDSAAKRKLASSYRLAHTPDLGDNTVGFRVVVNSETNSN